jgi:hypothetical protein
VALQSVIKVRFLGVLRHAALQSLLEVRGFADGAKRRLRFREAWLYDSFRQLEQRGCIDSSVFIVRVNISPQAHSSVYLSPV